MSDPIEELKKKLSDAVEDLTTLTVSTLVGTVKTERKPGKGWVVVSDATPTAIAVTEIRIDGDLSVLVPVTDANRPDKEWMEVHAAGVKAATEARAALIKSIVDLIRS